MGYLQALNLMVRAYKAARGVMPKGLDLLKLKMKARRKAIDAKKVIQFPPDKITPFYKPRPQGIQNLIKKGDVKIGQAPKTTKVKEPVDPKLVLQESEKEMAKRMMRENKEAIKRFKEKMKPRDDKATGGLANISQTYDNNPTLQSQFPNKQDYLDLFSSTTTTPPQTQTYAQMTEEAPAGIPAVKPIVPIIPLGQEGDGGGGGGITKVGPNRFDYGYTSLSDDLVQGESLKGSYRTPGTEANIAFLEDIGEGTIADEDYNKIEELKDTYYGAKAGLGNFYKTVSPFLNIKRGFEKAADFSRNIVEQRRREKAIKEAQEKARLADELARQMNAVYYDNPGATFTGGRYDGATSRSEYESNPTGFSGSS
jgi:hypothetical protein